MAIQEYRNTSQIVIDKPIIPDIDLDRDIFATLREIRGAESDTPFGGYSPNDMNNTIMVHNMNLLVCEGQYMNWETQGNVYCVKGTRYVIEGTYTGDPFFSYLSYNAGRDQAYQAGEVLELEQFTNDNGSVLEKTFVAPYTGFLWFENFEEEIKNMTCKVGVAVVTPTYTAGEVLRYENWYNKDSYQTSIRLPNNGYNSDSQYAQNLPYTEYNFNTQRYGAMYKMGDVVDTLDLFEKVYHQRIKVEETWEDRDYTAEGIEIYKEYDDEYSGRKIVKYVLPEDRKKDFDLIFNSQSNYQDYPNIFRLNYKHNTITFCDRNILQNYNYQKPDEPSSPSYIKIFVDEDFGYMLKNFRMKQVYDNNGNSRVFTSEEFFNMKNQVQNYKVDYQWVADYDRVFSTKDYISQNDYLYGGTIYKLGFTTEDLTLQRYYQNKVSNGQFDYDYSKNDENYYYFKMSYNLIPEDKSFHLAYNGTKKPFINAYSGYKEDGSGLGYYGQSTHNNNNNNSLLAINFGLSCYKTHLSKVYKYDYNGYASVNDVCLYMEGMYNEASGQCSHVEGYNNIAISENVAPFAQDEWFKDHDVDPDYCSSNNRKMHQRLGSSAHAEGVGVLARGAGAHAEGYSAYSDRLLLTSNNGVGQHIISFKNMAARGYGTHIEGYSINTRGNMLAFGHGSHVEGIDLNDFDDGETRFRVNLKSIIFDKFSIPDITNGANFGSYILKTEEKIDKLGFHSNENDEYLDTFFGYYKLYNLRYGSNMAIGDGSHVEGLGNVALGALSHVDGIYNIATNLQHVSGQFNYPMNYEKINFIVGCGTGTEDSNRKNSIYTDVDGNLYVSGKIYQNADKFDREDLDYYGGSEIPSLPKNISEGTYTLKATYSQGKITYQWILES